jgi:hypothetical protein
MHILYGKGNQFKSTVGHSLPQVPNNINLKLLQYSFPIYRYKYVLYSVQLYEGQAHE